MTRRCGLRAVIALLLGALGALGAPGIARAQESGPVVEFVGLDLTAYPDVRVRVSLPPELAEAAADGLTLTENGTPVDAAVTPLTDATVGVVLALDTSGSMQGEAIEAAKAAAIAFLDVLPDDARVAVVGFSTSESVLSEFTTDRGTTAAAIGAIVADGGTALYDGVVLSTQLVAASDADRHAIVVLSDGADSESASGLEEAASALAEDTETFYVVSLQTEETDGAALGALADAGAGRVVQAADPDDLAQAYQDLGVRIVNQYELAFTSATPDAVATYAVAIAGSEAATVQVAIPGRTPTATPTTLEERALPEPLTATAEPGLLQQDWVLYLGAFIIALAVAITVVLVVPSPTGAPRLRRRSLASDADFDPDANPAERAIASVRARATRVAEAAVDRTESEGRIDASLDRAGLVMRAGEFVAATFGVMVAAGIGLYLFLGPVGLAIGVLVPAFGGPSFLRFLTSRRNAKFADQLSDTLLIMAGALRSGFGVGQAIDTVAEEMDPPMSQEFQRAILETRLGRDVEDALDGIARRVQNEDFEWVVDAMRINRQVGGDLARILDQVSETIRARNRLKRQVSALTAEGRISALVLALLPVAIAAILFSSNPDYMEPLFSRTGGLIMLGVAVGLLVAGALWLKKLIDIEY